MFSKKLNPWFVWFVVTLFYAYQYILRVMPSILMSDITQKFSLTPEVFGQFSGVYYLGYSLAHLPVGILLDRFGPKKTVPIFILLTVVGLFPLLFAELWVYPIIGRVLIGVGSSAAILSVFKVIQMTFEQKKFSRILSFSVTLGLCGAIYGGGPVHLIKEKFGYEAVLIGLTGVGVALSVCAYLFIPAGPKTVTASSVGSSIRSILSNSRILSLCLLAGLMVGPLEGFADVWGAQFLRVVYGLDTSVAASLPSFIFLGMCFGGPALCFLADWKERHLEVVLASAVTMALAFCLILAMQVSIFVLTLLFLVIGVCSAYQILVIYKVSTLASPSATGLATATSNMVIMIFGYVFHSLIGRVVGLSGHFEDAHGLVLGISVIPVALTLAAVGFVAVLATEKPMAEIA